MLNREGARAPLGTDPSYEALPHWRAVYRALPRHLQSIAEPWPVREEWLRSADCEIHLDRWPVTQPRARMVLVHGGGSGIGALQRTG